MTISHSLHFYFYFVQLEVNSFFLLSFARKKTNIMLKLFKFGFQVVFTFLITNIQDVVILINFFLETSKNESQLKTDHVVLGQFLGFSTLLMLSLIGYTVSYLLPIKLFGFLGFVIIGFGINGFKDLYENLKKKKIDQQQGETILFSDFVNKTEHFTFFDDIKQIIKVSLVTIANGNDNIAIYVPIFVQSTSAEIIGYGLGFLFMVGVLCFVCYSFIHIPPVLKFAHKYAQFISPFVFIGLGIYILITSDCFPWLFRVIQTGQWNIE